MKSCKECGAGFQTKTSQAYCCKRCKMDSANRRKLAKYHATKTFPEIECEGCGKKFEKRWGNTRFCSKDCKTGYDGKYHVYILPEINYAGMTNRHRLRLEQHRSYKKVTEMKIIASYDCPKKAHLHETQLHVEGYEGFFVERSYE